MIIHDLKLDNKFFLMVEVLIKNKLLNIIYKMYFFRIYYLQNVIQLHYKYHYIKILHNE